jgi:hypothetical protein
VQNKGSCVNFQPTIVTFLQDETETADTEETKQDLKSDLKDEEISKEKM